MHPGYIVQNFQTSVVIAMTFMRVMQTTIHQVIGMVAMENRLMFAMGTVNAAFRMPFHAMRATILSVDVRKRRMALLKRLNSGAAKAVQEAETEFEKALDKFSPETVRTDKCTSGAFPTLIANSWSRFRCFDRPLASGIC
jgi:hypothetical protein